MSLNAALDVRSLPWHEDAVRAILRSWGGNARSVCIIIPPSAFLLDERVFVSLGALKVAASLRAGGYNVNVLDLSGVENFLTPLEDYLATCNDVAVGISTTTPQLPAVTLIRDTIRRLKPNLKIILGGPHVSLVYGAKKKDIERRLNFEGRGSKEARQLEEAYDVLVPGDGELAVFEALKDNAPKVVDGDERDGGFFLTNKMFSATPEPARDLVDLSSYHYSIEGHRATSLIAQLGCPFGCGFCGGRFTNTLRIPRFRSVESIVDEVEGLHKEYGYTGFMFYDDEMNVSKSFVQLMNGLSDLQSRLGVEFRLRGFVKAELFTEAQAKAMFRAGFRWLLCGFEAANERILTNIMKNATLADNTKCVETAKKAGLKIKALMSCGHPGESEETIRNIRDWLIQTEVDDFDCTVITTYPGTPYYDLASPHESIEHAWTYVQEITGDRLHALEVDHRTDAEYYKGDPDGGYKSFVFTDFLSAEQLVVARDMVERDVRRIRNIPFNAGAPALRYEHSMGQGLPGFIHRIGQGLVKA